MTTQDWQSLRLGELGEFRNGINFSRSEKGGHSDTALGLINVKDLYTDGPFIDLVSLDKVSLNTTKNLDRFKVKAGDIYFARSSVKREGVGVVSMATQDDEGALHCGFVIRFRLANKEVDQLFLAYVLRSPQYRAKIVNLSGGSAITNVSQDSLRSLPLSLPPLSLQKKIASILSAYDDLIEKNLRRIKILEEMAQNLYREWFVHFRFPGHEKVRMVVSPLGKIPEGWGEVVLGDVIEIRRGKNITKRTIVPGSVPVVAGGLTPAYYHDSANTRGPVITVSASGANAGFVNLYDEDVWASDCSFIDCETTPYVYYFYVQLKDRQAEITRLQRGSAQPHVYPKDLMRLAALDIPKEVLQPFSDAIDPIFRLRKTLSAKIGVLSQTRDLLLPKLISGDLDVSELDIDIGEEAA